MLGAVLIGAKGVGLERLQNSERLLTVLDYCQSGVLSGAQVDKGREPHLLVPDLYNPGEFRAEPIYDSRVDWQERRTDKCWIDVHAGELLDRLALAFRLGREQRAGVGLLRAVVAAASVER